MALKDELERIYLNDPILGPQFARGTQGERVPFLITYDRLMPGFNYDAWDVLLGLIDPNMVRPVAQLRVVLWASTAADLRDFVHAVMALYGSVGNLADGVMVIKMPTSPGEVALHNPDLSPAEQAIYAPNADRIN